MWVTHFFTYSARQLTFSPQCRTEHRPNCSQYSRPIIALSRFAKGAAAVVKALSISAQLARRIQIRLEVWLRTGAGGG